MRTGVVIGGVAAVLAIVGALFLFADRGSSTLAEAAAELDGKSMQIKVDIDFMDDEGSYRYVAEGPISEDNSRWRLNGTVSTNTVAQDFPMELLHVATERWVRYPGADVMPPGKEWMHPADGQGDPTGDTLAQFVDALRNAGDVHEVSDDERVLGKPVTHYEGRVDGEKIFGSGDTVPPLRDLVGKPVQVEAWIDGDGLPARIKLSAHPTFSMALDIVDYGAPVDIEAPDPATVVEEAEFDEFNRGG